jgi:Family of unknown function (DUF5995)
MKNTLILLFTLLTIPLAHAAQIPSSIKSDFRSSSRAARSIGQLAVALEANGDRRAQFAHIYSITIAATSRKLAKGAFENPDWVESLIVNYANIYRRTIRKELSGKRRELPLAWQYEFSYTERKDWIATFDVIYGIKVHITRDLVEALYITPTDFNNASIRRDFFRITTVLNSVMPQIWKVYARYSRSPGSGDGFSADAVSGWIGRLRQRAWEDAQATAHLSAAQKAAVLSKLDKESKRVRHFGILTVLH